MLNEDPGRILEICRSGKMTMRRGHHTSRVLKAMELGETESLGLAGQPLENLEQGAAVEPE
jgi:acetolactate synthase-1/3 small subunit